MTIEEVTRHSLQAKTGYRCALDFARGWKFNLGRAGPDDRQRAEAFDALRAMLEAAAGLPDGYAGDALEQFPAAWPRARLPLGVSMEAAVDFARRTAALPWTYPGDFNEERKAIWRAVCFFYHVADERVPGTFIFPVAQYEEATEKTGGKTDRQTANRFLNMLCEGTRAALFKLRPGKSNRAGRGVATVYGMTAQGLRCMPSAAFFDGAAGSGRTCTTGGGAHARKLLPPVPVRRPPPVRRGPVEHVRPDA